MRWSDGPWHGLHYDAPDHFNSGKRFDRYGVNQTAMNSYSFYPADDSHDMGDFLRDLYQDSVETDIDQEVDEEDIFL